MAAGVLSAADAQPLRAGTFQAPPRVPFPKPIQAG
jgi:hypothetical protein